VAPDWFEGQVLPGFLAQPDTVERSIYVLEAKQNSRSQPLRKVTAALVKGRYKLVYYRGYPGYDEVYELYDLEVDPEELADLYQDLGTIADQLRSELVQNLEQKDQP
jgi:arylsulfatase A-like enzyme